MKLAWRHRWDVTPAAARKIQDQARGRVLLADDDAFPICPVTLTAVDVGYDRASNLCAAALVIWSIAENRELWSGTHVVPCRFPYVPGLLSFREIPPLLPLFRRLSEPPALLICDGQGIAHPRRLGLASHLGLVLECPSMGWAKTRLIGTYREPAQRRGAATSLMDNEEQIGWVLRSRNNCRPTFISPGNRISLERSLEVARMLCGHYRLCEPARRAHQLTRLAMCDALSLKNK